jgi:hypothetical protein
MLHVLVAFPQAGFAATVVAMPMQLPMQAQGHGHGHGITSQRVALRSDGRNEAAALARLFARSCFRHAGDRTGLRTSLLSQPFRPASDAATARLLARPGQAYHVAGEPGHLVVLSFDDGWCGDGGTDIDPHALTMRLSGTMRTQGVVMRLMGAEQDGREQRYLLTRPAPAVPIVLLVLLRSSGHLMQASLFAAPLPSEPEHHR